MTIQIWRLFCWRSAWGGMISTIKFPTRVADTSPVGVASLRGGLGIRRGPVGREPGTRLVCPRSFAEEATGPQIML